MVDETAVGIGRALDAAVSHVTWGSPSSHWWAGHVQDRCQRAEKGSWWSLQGFQSFVVGFLVLLVVVFRVVKGMGAALGVVAVVDGASVEGGGWLGWGR